MFGERAKNSYHGCERVSAPSDAAHRQPRAMHVETTPLRGEHRMSGTVANPIGITNPPIDDLLQAAALIARFDRV